MAFDIVSCWVTLASLRTQYCHSCRHDHQP